METSRTTNGGFTLVELMVAMLITMVGLLGLLKTLSISMEHNVRNQLRDEAVLVGEQVMSFQKVRPFEQLSTTHMAPIQSRIRSGGVQYAVQSLAPPPDLATYPSASQTDRMITVTVNWNYKGLPYSHSVMSMRSQ